MSISLCVRKVLYLCEWRRIFVKVLSTTSWQPCNLTFNKQELDCQIAGLPLRSQSKSKYWVVHKWRHILRRRASVLKIETMGKGVSYIELRHLWTTPTQFLIWLIVVYINRFTKKLSSEQTLIDCIRECESKNFLLFFLVKVVADSAPTVPRYLWHAFTRCHSHSLRVNSNRGGGSSRRWK